MHPTSSSIARGPRPHRGSALLASCLRRMAYMLPVIALLWCLTGWALLWD
ncbi:MAG: hypothetical protein WBA83_14840 [Burkholderiaceae bacterium]